MLAGRSILLLPDLPFNSNADYNVIFREQSGQKPAAQIKAFTDTWHWDLETDRAREETLTSAPERVATPTPGVSAPGLWSETPSALDIPEAGEDDLAALDDADNGLE